MSNMKMASGRSVSGLLARAERFAFGDVPGLGRIGGWTAALSGVIVAAFCNPALAGPDGARVVRGNVNISRNGAETVIRASHNSIINFRSFDIGRGETVRFLQPNSQSRVLNRIESRMPTRIDGSLIANGRVYLINPAGVMFGQGSVINVNQMYAAAGNLSDKDFVRGIDRFTNLRGEVSNYGSMTANYVALVGDRAANMGEIVAPQGTVVMASGSEVLIGEKNGNVFLKISGEAAKNAAGQAGTENTGTINAKGGRVSMGAGDVFGMAVRHTGTTTAKKVTIEGQGTGEVRASGTIDATNTRGKGGEVKVLGENVALSGATIDASGSSGGGTVLVGGNYQGKGDERNATKTFITADSTIKADATDKGNGGKVIVWADQVTRYYGEISAKGGANGGNGGFAEVSGKEFLVFRGGADLGAAKGNVGDLLLDPRDITIQNTGTSDALMADNIVNFNEPDTTTDITLSDEVLEVNANVTLQADRDIFVNQAVTNSNTGRSITMFAGNNITVSAAITTAGGNISLTAGNRGDSTGTATGSITLGAALDTTDGGDTGGNISLTAGASGTINLNADVTARSGTITFTGPVAVTGTRTVDAGDGNGNNTGAISFTGAITGNGSDILNVVAGNNTGRSAVSFGGAVSGLDGLTVDNATTLASNGIGTTAGGNVAVEHSSTHTVNGTINIGGTYTQTGGGGTTFAGGAGITTSNDDVSFTNGVTANVNTEFNTGTGIITLSSTGAIASGMTLTLTSDERVNLDGGNNTITGPGGLVLRPGAAVETRISNTGAGGRLDIDPADLLAVASGVSLLTIGNSGVNAALNINNATVFNGATTLVTGGVLTVNADITATTGTLTLHGGADGGNDAGGSVAFAASMDLNAGSIVLRAGNGAGTAAVNAITNTPTFRAAAGGATSPGSFTVQQDASIADADVPVAAQFPGTLAGMDLTLDSDAGNVTISTAAKVAGTDLILNGTTVNVSTAIAPRAATINATTANLSGNIATSGTAGIGAIQINGNVVLNGNISLTTIGAAAGSSIGITGTVSGTTDVTDSLTLNAGTGGVLSLGSTVGSGAIRLTNFTITNAGTASVTGGSFAVTANHTAATSLTYNGAIDATTGGITLSAPTINLNAGATTTGGGIFAATSGTLFVIGGNLTLDGAFTKNGAGTTNLGANITTTGDLIDFNAGAVVLTANSILNTTISSLGGAGVEFASTVNGTFDLTVHGGTGGAIIFTGAVGGSNAIDVLTITNGATLATAAVSAATIDATTVTTASFGGLLTVGAGGIDVTSATVNFSGGATTTGGITIDASTAFNASGGNISGATGFLKNGAGLSTVGVDISTTNSGLNFNAGDLIFNGASTLSAGTAALSTQAVDLNGQTVTWLANSFSISGNVTGNGLGSLRIGGATTGTTLGVAGGAGTAQFDATDLSFIQDGATGQLIFGASGQTANITVASSGYTDDVLFTTTGTIFTTGAVNAADLLADLAFTGGTISLGGNVTTTGGNITITGNTVLTTNVSMDTTFAAQPGGDILLTGSLSGTAGGLTESINFIAGSTGDVTVTGASGTDLSSFQITAAEEAALGAITATTIDINTTGAGTNTFAAMNATTIDIDTNTAGIANYAGLLTAGSGGIDIVGGTVSLTGGATTTTNGAFAISTANTFTIGAVALSLDGSFTKSGLGNCVIANDLTTTNDAITFNSTATVGAANVTLTGGTAAITFNNLLGLGGNNLTLLANAIDFAGLGTVTGTGAGTLRLGGATNATTIGVGSGAGTLVISTTDIDALANQAAAIIALGRTGQTGNIDIGGATFLDAMSASTTGTVFVTGAGIVGSESDASVTLTGGLIDLGANIQTSGAAINLFGPVTVSTSVTLDTTGASSVPTGGDVTMTGDVNSGAVFTNALGIFAGSDGDVSLQNVGTGTALAQLLIFSSDEVTADAITAGSIGVVVDNLGTYNGLLTGNGAVGFGIILTGTGAHTVNAGATTINGGDFEASNVGLLTINAALTLDGLFIRNGGLTTLGANITTTNDTITFLDGDDDVTLSANGLTLSSGTAAITFGGTLAAGANSLTLRGNGIDFTGGLNSVTGTGAGTLTLVGSTDGTSIGVATGAGTLNISQGDLNAITDNAFAFIDIGAATGTSTVDIGTVSLRDPMRFRAGAAGGVVSTSGVVTGTTADSNLLFAGATNSVSNVTTLGTVTILGTNNTSGGVTGSSISITGSLNTISGNLITPGGTITITGPVTLTADSLWDSTNSGANAAGATITATSTIGGFFDLSFRAGTAGDISVGGAIAGLDAITVVSVADTTADFDGNVSATSYTQNAGSANFDGTLTLGGVLSLAGATFQFDQGVSAGSYTQTSGSSTFDGTLTVAGASNIAGTTFTFNQAVTSGAFTQTSGDSTFNGLLSTSGAGGISLTGGVFTVNAGVTTTGGGDIAINNTGLLTIANTGWSIAGGFSKVGAGATSLGANITTNTGIAFGGGDTTLATNIALSTGAGAGDVTFNSGVTGGQALTITAGTGAVAFNAQVGAASLTDLTVASSGSITALSTITANGIVIFTSTGNVSLSGLVSADDGFVSTGAGFTQLGGITTVNNAIDLNHTGLVLNTGDLSAGSGAITVDGGALTQNGNASGGSYVAMTTTGNIDIGGTITVGGAVTLTSGQDVIVSNTIAADGGFSSSGFDYTQTGGGITTVNTVIDINHGGTVSAGILNAGTAAITINGATISQNGTADGGSYAATASSGGVTIAGAVNVGGTAVLSAATNTVISSTIDADGGFTSTGIDFTQSGGGITTASTALFINHTGAVGAGILTAGTGAVTINGSTISQNGAASGGSYVATATGNIDIADDITALSIDISAGTSGLGNLTFSAAGVDLSATGIELSAGDGTGGAGSTSFVDLLTNAPMIRGFSGGSTSPTVFVHEQDADITNSLTAAAAQWGNTTAGVDYSLCSNDGSVFITDGTKVAGSILTLCGFGPGGCVDFGADLSVDSLSVTTAWCVSANVTLETTVGTLSLLGLGDTFANNVTFRGPEIDFGDSVLGSGAIRFESLNAGDDINFGGAASTADLDLTATELGFFNDGYASLTIGRADGTGTIQSAGAFTAFDPFFFQSPTGDIRIDHALTGTSGATFQFDGPTRLTANIVTESGSVLFLSAVEIAGNVLIDTTNAGAFAGGNVGFATTVDADDDTNNRDLRVTVGGASASFSAAVGGTEALGSLTVDANTTTTSIILAGVTTNNNQAYNGNTGTSGDLETLTGGSIAVTGSFTLAADITVDTNGTTDGSVTFSGIVDGDTFGPHALIVDAGTGNASFLANSGGVDPLASLTVGAADIILHSVTTAGGQSYTPTGTAFLNGNLSGVGISVAGNTILNANITTTGSTFVNFGGTINSASGLSRTLTVNSPTTTFGGIIGGTAGGELGSLTTDAAGTTNLNGGAITVVDAMSFGDNVQLGANTTLTSTSLGDVTFGGTVNTDGSARSLAVNTGGGTFFNGLVGSPAALSTLTTDAAGFTRLAANVTTTGALTFNDIVQLDANVAINAASATFGNKVNSVDAFNARSLTVTTTGAATFLDNVGETVLSSLSVNAATISLRSVETSGNQAYTGTTTTNGIMIVNSGGTLTITGNVLVAGTTTMLTPGAAGQDITITGTINALSSPQALIVNAHNDLVTAGAGVFLQGNIGLGVGAGEFALSTLDVIGGTYSVQQVRTTSNQAYQGSGTLNGNITTTGTGFIDFDGNVDLGANITIATTDGDIIFRDGLDGDTAGTRTLIVNVGGANSDATFDGEVGGDRALASLTVTNGGIGAININGGQVSTTGDQTYNNRVVLGDDTLIEANDVTFGDILDSDGTFRALTIDSNTVASVAGVTRFNAAVGEVSRLASLTTNADGSTRFGGNVRTDAGMTINDSLLIGGDSVIDGGSGQMMFRNGINAAADATLPRLFLHTTFSSTASQQAMRFGGSIGTTGIFRGVSFNTGSGFVARGSPQKAATAVFADSFNLDGTINAATVASTDVFTIVAGNEGIRMGVNEKLTVFGTLRLVGSGANNSQVSIPGEVRLGDISALGDIVVRANTIRFVGRGGGTLFEKQIINNAVAPNAAILEVADSGRADIVAGGTFDFQGTLDAADRDLVLFSNTTGIIQGGLATSGFSIRNFTEGTDGIAGGVSLNLFRNPANTNQLFGLDLSAKGNPGTSIATSIAGAIPRDTETREVATPVTVGRALREPLQEMGVYVRDLRFEETVEFLVGWATYRDIPEDRMKPKYEVALNRLQAETVQAAVDAYRELMYAPVMGADGQPVLDEQGQPQIAKRVEDIKYAIGEAWNAYTGTVDEPTGQGFRAYLETRTDSGSAEEKDALLFLDAARDVCDRLDAMGLSPFETSIPKNRLIGEMLPAAMSEEQLKTAIYGNQLAMF